jgi:hypothetical protein
MQPPTKAEYDAAKAHQEQNAEAWAANDPDATVLAHTSTIRRFEHAENRRRWPDLPHDPTEEVDAP